MTGPYVYGAPNAYPPFQQTPYTAYYNSPHVSPFIPPTELSNYPPSPYRSHSPLPNHDMAPNTVQFPGSYDIAGYPTQYPTQYPGRPRAPSYHGPPNPYAAPVVAPPPQVAPWPRPHRLSNPLYPGVAPASQSYPSSPWTGVGTPLPLYTDLPTSFNINPFLNGETPRHDFMFNLSSQYCSPMQVIHGQYVPLGLDASQQPATHPPVYRLTIICDELPEWPIHLQFNPESYREQTGQVLPYAPPITLGDALSEIHRKLHERITHGDWARLDHRKKNKVSQAFTARCQTAPTMQEFLKSDGVKKVDYLQDKIWFKGLIRTSDPEVLKLVVSRRR